MNFHSRAHPSALWWPTSRQALLLRAILSNHEIETLECWRRWTVEQSWETIDQESFALVPLLFKRLEGLVDSAELTRYKGTYSLAWYKKSLLFARAKPTIEALVKSGMEPVLLKGAALADNYYEHALRTLSDIDVWVAADKAEKAMGLLEVNGWRRSQDVASVKKQLRLLHGTGFYSADGQFQIDLHWRFLWCANDRAVNDFFRTQTIAATWQGIPVRIFRPEAMFLHVCIHGARAGEYIAWRRSRLPKTLQWIPDCAAILAKAGPNFNWDLVVAYAKVLNAELQMQAAVEYLATHPEIGIPAGAAEKFVTGRVTLLARAHYALTMGPFTWKDCFLAVFLYTAPIWQLHRQLKRLTASASAGPLSTTAAKKS